MKLKIILFFLFSSFFLLAQQPIQLKEKIEWQLQTIRNSSGQSIQTYKFEGSQFTSSLPGIALYKKEFEVPGNGTVNLQLIPRSTERVQIPNIGAVSENLKSDFQTHAAVYQSRNKFYATVELIALRIDSKGSPEIGNQSVPIELLKEFDISLEFIPAGLPTKPLPNFANQSVLQSGVWHKIAIKQRGVYKIDKSFLEKNLKLDVSGIDPRNIRLFGNGGTPLPESTDSTFEDDLKENAIFVKGETDGRFDESDYILFYANGPDLFQYDPVLSDYSYTKNPYTDASYYFIKIDQTRGKRVSTLTGPANPDYQSNSSFDFKHIETDLVNLLDLDAGSEGSGKNWYGEELSNTRFFDYGNSFIFDHIDVSKTGLFSFAFAGRAPIIHTVSAQVENQRVDVSIPYVIYSSINRFANIARKSSSFQPVSDLVKAQISFPQAGGSVSEGWIDFMQISVWKKLIWSNKPIYIMDPTSALHDVTSFTVSNTTSSKLVWDISNPLEITEINSSVSNGQLQFNASTRNAYKSFLVLDESFIYEAPQYIGSVGNQNLHGLKDPEMIIIYHSDFKSEAERLQNHRSKYSNLNVQSLEINQIYNEFSSGSQDPTAIRNFMRMLYIRNPKFKYLAIFGDGSYDFRHLNKRDENQNFVPTYETEESLDPITSFPTDDYFGLLDPAEGLNLSGKLDLNIGRIVARTPDEAKNLVDKIIRYDTDPKMMEEWKLHLVFSSDDEDSNVHFNQSERISESIHSAYPLFNEEKIHLDAYEQITTPGGERYPEVNKAFANAFFQGALVVNYMGHGGYSGLAQERILQNTDIKSLENYYKLPLVIVASCTFNGFDDPTKTNAGEEGLHNPKGGFLALFSTVRAVYSDDNFDLTSSVYNYIFQFENGLPLPLGEIMRRAKNDNSAGFIRTNSRKFLLFGDPAQRLAIPLYKNEVLTINDKALSATPDTFRALETIQVKGQVVDRSNGLQSDFNGKLYITVYDKEISLRTKANDPSSYVANYNLQKNIIYKGLVEVQSGLWNFSFIIPKDINYAFGAGKISLYATDEKSRDAAGYEDRLIIGGVSNDSIRDDQPPVVNVFLNDDQFVNGGICNPNPILFSKISDDFGINISGNSIGHDLIAVIDQNTQSPIILNQVYKSKLNNPKEGELNYPLKNLSPGKHTVTITAWDISNNPGTGSLEFNVVDSDQSILDQVYNYPNPFSNSTEFQFETNILASELEVVIQLQSISGHVVKTIRKTIFNNGYRISGIQWDGKDDFGSELANGVYLYRISINAKTGSEIIHKRSSYQKLVLIK